MQRCRLGFDRSFGVVCLWLVGVGGCGGVSFFAWYLV